MYDLPGFARPAEPAEVIAAAAFVIVTFVVGWVLQRVVVHRMRRRRAITTWGGDELVVAAIRHVAVWWFTLGGLFAAVFVLPLTGRLREGLARLLTVAFVTSLAFTLSRVTTGAIKLFATRTGQPTRSSSIYVMLARLVIAVLGLLVLMQTFGVSITPVLTAVGVGGLAVALALQDTLSNFFAGLQIIATKKVKPGDYVRLETGQEGYVTDVDWRHTSIRQLPSNMVLVPNSKLANSVITNFHYPDPEMSVLIDVGVSYGSDLRHVERVTVDVARETLRDIEGGVEDFEPFVRFHTFNDSSVDFTVILRVREFTDQYPVKHEFVKRLHRAFEREEIVIPYPIRTLDWPQAGEQLGDAERRTPAPKERDARPSS